MIQRIQSVYLLFAACLCALTLCMPLAELITPNTLYEFNTWGIYTIDNESTSVYSTFVLAIIQIIVAILSFGNIFLYKKRIRQMRICSFSILLLVGYCIVFALYIYQQKEALNASVHYKFATGIPLIGIILEYLAVRGIGKDEALIRSLNRLR